MHKYLRAVGFSTLKRSQEFEVLIKKVFKECDSRRIINIKNRTYAEFAKEFAENCGVNVCGELDEFHDFHVGYCFPYLTGTKISSTEDIEIEELSDRDGFIAAYDDISLNITMIFTLSNIADFYEIFRDRRGVKRRFPVRLSGLSTKGKILLPVFKSERFVKDSRKKHQKKNALIAAAKNGDESAIEILAMEELDAYNEVVTRSLTEDIYSIVDNNFMPHGYESNIYSLIGDITGCKTITNSFTGEKLHIMSITCNEVQMDICINSRDLLGEPSEGMRFKGIVCMQGNILFADKTKP